MKMRDLLAHLEIDPRAFLLPGFLSFAASLFEGVSVALLIPLAQAIVRMDPQVVMENRLIGPLITPLMTPAAGFTPVIAAVAGLVFLTAVLKLSLQYFSALSAACRIRRHIDWLRRRVFARYLGFGKLFFDNASTGELHEILTSLTQRVAGQLIQLQHLLGSLFMLGAYLIVLFAISWRLTLLVLCLFPLLHYAVRRTIAKTQQFSFQLADRQQALGKRVFDVLSCITLVKSRMQEPAEQDAFDAGSRDLARFEYLMDKKANLVTPIQELILLLSVLVLLLAVSRHAEAGGDVGRIGAFMVYFYALRKASSTFGLLNTLRARIAVIAGPVTRIRELLDSRDPHPVPAGDRVFSGLTRHIEFRHLCFTYEGRESVLRDVSFFVEKGKRTALVGTTGSGKSTLVHLMMRFYDCPPGTILVDGRDIRSFTLDSLRKQITLVGQDALLFNDTLHANLLYGLDAEAGEDDLHRALEQAQLTETIRALPQGLDTVIGDRGVQLSGGERQRLAIARAMLRPTEILILDEATSALDGDTEVRVRRATERLMRGRTTIVIAHRLSTIAEADHIIVLDGGLIVEQGSLQTLLSAKGKFAHYLNAQAT